MGKVTWFLALTLASAFAGFQATAYFEVRLGLYNADGVAHFDAVQVVRGDETSQRYEEAPTVKGEMALILHEPAFPQNLASPSPEKLAH